MATTPPRWHDWNPCIGRGVLSLLVAAIGAIQFAAAEPSPGVPIADYIAELRDIGYTIIYSDALLTSGLRIEAAPAADNPLAKLREVLAPHGLALERGPRDSWLIVAGTSAPEDVSAQAQPRFVPSPPQLENVVVSASRYEFGRETEASRYRLQGADLENLPTLGDDALRAPRVLPGLTGSGLSAQFNVRGGEADEALLLIDGVRLYDPYHLKDFQNLFSSIGPRVLDSVDVHTGGFPAEFGDRMSAVVELHTRTPDQARHHEVGLSLFTTSVLSSGRFADDRGEWLTSLRRGNVDVVADAADSEFGQPQYTDFFNKLSFELESGRRLTTGMLMLNDKISLHDAAGADAGADSGDAYLWLALTDDEGLLTSRYLFSRAQLDDRRGGTVADADTSFGNLDETRSFESLAFKGDWSYTISDRQLVRFGIEFEELDADYEFESSATFPFPIDLGGLTPDPAAASARGAIEGRQRAAYAAYRVRPREGIAVEAGLRWDQQSYTSEEQRSPRINVLFDVGTRGTLRASWGRFFQSQDPSELQVGDGIQTLYPAQRAEHTVLGFEYLLGDATTLRVEAYRKTLERLRPRFENLYHRVSLLPELLPDRVMVDPARGEATGVEFALDGQAGAWAWWANLARSSVRETLGSRTAPRSWDERWSGKAGASWKAAQWDVTLIATAHEGWPTTALALEGSGLVAGPYNAERLATFQTLDIKATRRVELERSDLSWFLELTNALNRDNPCCLDYAVERNSSGRTMLVAEIDNWLPLVPSFGILWEF